jgi:hypothetical protein
MIHAAVRPVVVLLVHAGEGVRIQWRAGLAREVAIGQVVKVGFGQAVGAGDRCLCILPIPKGKTWAPAVSSGQNNRH